MPRRRRELKCGIASWTEYALKKGLCIFTVHSYRLGADFMPHEKRLMSKICKNAGARVDSNVLKMEGKICCKLWLFMVHFFYLKRFGPMGREGHGWSLPAPGYDVVWMRQDANGRLTNVKMTGEKAGMKQNKEDFLTGVGAVDAEHVVLLDLTDQVGALFGR